MNCKIIKLQISLSNPSFVSFSEQYGCSNVLYLVCTYDSSPFRLQLRYLQKLSNVKLACGWEVYVLESIIKMKIYTKNMMLFGGKSYESFGTVTASCDEYNWLSK